MRLSIIFLFILVNVSGIDAQVKLIPYREGNKWGYKDTSGSTVVPLVYEAAYPLALDRGLVKRNNKYGYVNETGALVIPIQFDSATSFHIFGRAYVCIGNDSHFIDLEGNKAYQVVGCGGSREGCSIGNIFEIDGKFGIIPSLHSDTLVPAHYLELKDLYTGSTAIARDTMGMYGIINWKDSVLAPFIYSTLEGDNWEYLVYSSRGGLHGMLDVYGNVLAHALYDEVEYVEGLVEAKRNGGLLGYVYQGKEYWKD